MEMDMEMEMGRRKRLDAADARIGIMPCPQQRKEVNSLDILLPGIESEIQQPQEGK